MKKEQKTARIETSILPIKYVDLIEDVFHAILAIALFGTASERPRTAP